MVIVTHESYDSVLVGTRENRMVSSRRLKTASEYCSGKSLVLLASPVLWTNVVRKGHGAGLCDNDNDETVTGIITPYF